MGHRGGSKLAADAIVNDRNAVFPEKFGFFLDEPVPESDAGV
jgi:hypothetical protein